MESLLLMTCNYLIIHIFNVAASFVCRYIIQYLRLHFNYIYLHKIKSYNIPLFSVVKVS
jgi:hypothetical protein